jgi:hypothetical protein
VSLVHFSYVYVSAAYLVVETILEVYSHNLVVVDSGCASRSASTLIPMFARTKHTKIDYHFERESVYNNLLEILSVSTGDQVADGFTKHLSSQPIEVYEGN